jgi:hypothetical protein
MVRLYRPSIPLDVRIRVVLRQLGEMFIEEIISSARGHLGKLLAAKLEALASLLGCEVKDLRLDHDPALATRQRLQYSSVIKPIYFPDANDPEYLNYRPHGPQFEHSHLIKTNVRGEHGQHPDRVLIKKARRLERGPKPKRGPGIKSRGFEKPSVKPKWASRPFNRRKK